MTLEWRREGRGARNEGTGPQERPRLHPPIGQGEAMVAWLRLARAGTLPHGLLVEGPRGSGKSTVLAWFAAALLCRSDLDADGPCGVCTVCRRVASRSHPDLLVLDRAQNAADKEKWGKLKSFYVITIDQVRQAQTALQQHAVEGGARVLVIEDADCLDEEGQNALLKTLEEPGARTWLLLEAGNPDQLLPTVRSRAQRFRTRPLGRDALERELAARLPQHRDRFARAIEHADGSLGEALAACTERAVQIHDLVQAMLARPDRLRPVATVQAVLAGLTELWQKLEAARTFLRALRRSLCRHLHGLAVGDAATYPAPRAEPWTTWLERTIAAEQDLDLLIPPEQALTACLVAFTVV
jgi:DNA polymerase-3 subunit delta'